MTEGEIRAKFPGTRHRVYFNAAAASLLPQPVIEAMHDMARRQGERGILCWAEGIAAMESARKHAALLVGTAPENVAFVANTAEGIAKVASGLAWREGDEIVLGDLEYPANVYPWAAQRPSGARLCLVRSEEGRLPAERLVAALGPRTRVLAVSMVQFTSGYRVDLATLGEGCRKRGILLVVDAIQGLGVFPLDVHAMGIGALAVDGRKWLMGPAGAGFLYVDPDWVERIRPRGAGALSVTNSLDMLQYMQRLDAEGQLDLGPMLRPGAGRYEAGYPNVLGLAGLGAALELGEAIGRGHIHGRVTSLVDRLVGGLMARGHRVYGPRTAGERSGIVAFSVPRSAEKVFEDLSERGFALAVRDGRMRAAPHVYNTADEVDSLLAELDALA